MTEMETPSFRLWTGLHWRHDAGLALEPSLHHATTNMSEPLNSYLRTHRKISGLTQTEVAYLLEAESAQTISRLEHDQQTPDLAQAFALSVLFDVPLDELFIGLFRSIEMRTQNHSYLLRKLLADDPDDELKKQKLRTLARVYESALRNDA